MIIVSYVISYEKVNIPAYNLSYGFETLAGLNEIQSQASFDAAQAVRD